MKIRPTPKALLIVLAIAILAWTQNPVDSGRASLATQSLAPLSMADTGRATLLGRETSLDDQGVKCEGGPGCHACDEYTAFTTFQAAGPQVTYKNPRDYPIVWQLFAINADGSWTNLCDVAYQPQSVFPCVGCLVQPNCDFYHESLGAIYLAANQTGEFDVRQGATYAQKIFGCNRASPSTCADSDANQADDFKVAGTVTVTLSDGAQTRHPDLCEAHTLKERFCDATTVGTKTKECGAYGSSWTCDAGACKNCQQRTYAACRAGQPTYYGACGNATAKEETCGLSDMKCQATLDDASQPKDAWCVNSRAPTSYVAAFANPENDEEYCLKTPGLTRAQVCVNQSYARKASVTPGELVKDDGGLFNFDVNVFSAAPSRQILPALIPVIGTIGGIGLFILGKDVADELKEDDRIDATDIPHFLLDSDNPMCVYAWGDATCEDGGECVRAVNSEADSKKLNKAIYDDVQGELSDSSEALLEWTLAVLAPGRTDWDEDTYEQYGACVRHEGFFAKLGSWLGVSPGTATLILLGGGAVLLLLLFMPRRS